MRLLYAALLALVLVPLPALARHAHKRAPQPDDVAKPAFPGGVSATFDVPYAALPGLTLDIYVPRPRPAPLTECRRSSPRPG